VNSYQALEGMITVERTQRAEGITVGLLPLLLLLITTAWVGFLSVLLIKDEGIHWLAGIMAAASMGSGIVYFTMLAQSNSCQEEVVPTDVTSVSENEQDLLHMSQGNDLKESHTIIPGGTEHVIPAADSSQLSRWDSEACKKVDIDYLIDNLILLDCAGNNNILMGKSVSQDSILCLIRELQNIKGHAGMHDQGEQQHRASSAIRDLLLKQ